MGLYSIETGRGKYLLRFLSNLFIINLVEGPDAAKSNFKTRLDLLFLDASNDCKNERLLLTN